MDYTTCVQRLFQASVHGGMKLGLSNMLTLLRSLGSPEKKMRVIHVAGTNGKGSVTTKIAVTLQEEGYNVGLYTSPHISSFRERIQINQILISEDDVVRHAERVFLVSEKEKITATFFELTTAIAFCYFEEQKVDFIALETGLGGRFDATNVCHPILSVITSLSIDHRQFLGTTIEQIAYEKAGIIKPGVAVVCGAHAGKGVIEAIALQQGSPFYSVERVEGHFDDENRSIASKALEVLSQSVLLHRRSIDVGLKALPSCRFEIVPQVLLEKRFLSAVPRAVLLDVAHNCDGLRNLFQRISLAWGDLPITCVFGISSDKDVQECVSIVVQRVQSIFLVQAETARAVDVSILQTIAHSLTPACSISAFPAVVDGMRAAFSEAQEKGHLLVVCGSFFIMQHARCFLGYDDIRDFCNLNEQYSLR